MVGFVLHSALHIEPSIVAMLGAGVQVAVTRLPSDDFLE
jgi:Na+/H+ antiporter NhaD/arsenite permease-like protein